MPFPVLKRSVPFLRTLFPNGRLAGVAIAGIALELGLLIQTPHHVLQHWSPVMLLALAWLAWFWLSLTWVLRIVQNTLNESREHYPRSTALASGVWGLIVTMLFALQVASWGFYCHTGMFANIEVIRFLVVNPTASIWLDLTFTEQASLVVLAVAVLLLLGAMPRIVRWLSEPHWTERLDDEQQESLWGSSWRTATMVLLLPSVLIANELSEIRQTAWVSSAKTSLHPMTSLALSTVEMFAAEAIEPCLDVTELTPRSVDWTPPSTGPRPSVIVLAVESLRPDAIHLVHQGQEVLPNINRLTRRSVEYTRAYAQSTHSDYADVCIVSSLYPLRSRRHHYYTRKDPWPKTLAFDVFKQAGYATAIISSQNESWGQMDRFLETSNLDVFYDAQRSGLQTAAVTRDPGMAHEIRMGTLTAGRLEDAHTMERAIDWVTQNIQQQQPFFLSMNFQSSHFPYDIPESVPRPFQPCELAPHVSFMQYPEADVPSVKNAYYNGIHCCDHEIGRMVAALEKLQALDDVILIVLGENGEAFHENGYCGHAREPVEPVVNVATVIHAPGFLEPGTEDYPLEHVDLLPTLFGLLGWPAHPNFQGRDLYAADRPAIEERLLYFHANSAAAQADAVLLAGRWKYHIDYRRQRTALYDLQHDPGERHDLAHAQPDLAQELHLRLREWRQRQLAYYHFPHYYSEYFPPRSPVWSVTLP